MHDDISDTASIGGTTAEDMSSLDSVKDDEAYLIQDEDSLPYVNSGR